MRRRRSAKPRSVSYELIPHDSVIGHPMYALLHELVKAHHEDLRDARIALAWCTSWRRDADGHLTIGKAKKASDLDRELAAWDFIILLNRTHWMDLRVPEAHRQALLDHELCHCALKYDTTGEPMEDVRGRKIWRTRKHDVEEFSAIVKRHGCYKADLEAFATALGHQKREPFKPCETCADSPGWVPVLVDGVACVKRCECYVRYVEQQDLQLSVSA
jgi:hypothetical protein